MRLFTETVGINRLPLVWVNIRVAVPSAKKSALGYDLSDNQMQDAFQRFKDLADRKKHVFDDDIVALIDDEVAHGNDRIKVVSWSCCRY